MPLKVVLLIGVMLILLVTVIGGILLWGRISSFNASITSTSPASSALWGPLGGDERVNVALYGFGALLEAFGPGLGCTGTQMVIWGMFISTVAVYHVTYLVNSATHLIGSRRFQTKDDSRNSLVIALLTFGEGWHNNHHHYPNSVRQGFYWWEIDITWYILKMMSWLGLVWELRPVPKRILLQAKKPAPALVAPSVATPS